MRNLSVKSKLSLLVGLAISGLFVIVVVSFMVINSVKIKGDAYSSIILSKDLLADILPPPEYIIESRLVTSDMLRANPAEFKELKDKLIQLEKDYETRQTYWSDDSYASSYLKVNPEVRTLILEKSKTPAREYFKIAINEFIPALESGDTLRAQVLFDGKLKGFYAEHRSAIDELVPITTQVAVNDEQSAVELVSDGNMYIISAIIIVTALLIFLSVMIIQVLTGSLVMIQSGLLSFFRFLNRESTKAETIDLKSEDEFGQMAKVINENIALIEKGLVA
ncbi:MAG: hypothetical protein Q8O20_10545, partial [Sulfuricurvum sp.]|nr:hypothetical protein [Sulfuricurvum sp.]